MARKLIIMENEKHPLDLLKNDEITQKPEKNFFSLSRHISRPKVCISHFPRFSVFSPYSRSYSVHFSFFKFFEKRKKWEMQTVGPTIRRENWKSPKMRNTHFSSMIFSFLAISHVLQWSFLNFPPLSVFLVIFHVEKWRNHWKR